MRECSLFKITKEQILMAIERATTFNHSLNKIKDKMQEPVTINCWFGLKTKTITKHEHTLKIAGYNYAFTAHVLEYISLEEKELSDYLWNCPSLKSLKAWLRAEEVYLSSEDFDKFYTLLYKEPGEK